MGVMRGIMRGCHGAPHHAREKPPTWRGLVTVTGPRPSGRLDEEGLARGQPFEYEFERLTIAAASGGTVLAAALGDPTKVLPALGIGLRTLSSEASRDSGETPL